MYVRRIKCQIDSPIHFSLMRAGIVVRLKMRDDGKVLSERKNYRASLTNLSHCTNVFACALTYGLLGDSCKM